MSPEDRAKLRHDLKSSLRTLKLFVSALEDGYRFEDETAPAKRQAIAKAVSTFDRHLAPLLALLTDEQPGIF